MPVDLVFDGVLDGDDLVLGRADLGQGGVEGRRLAAAGRTGDQDHAVGLGDVAAELLEDLVGEAEQVEPELGDRLGDHLLVQDADDGILAVDAGHDRDAEVDRLVLDPQPEPAVLGDAALGDVQVGHDLDPGDDRAT